jgi:PEP-CTERM motif
MTKRWLFLMLVAGVVVWGVGAPAARAGQVDLPTTLDQLLPAGSFVVTGLEPDTFSNFTFSASAVPPTTPTLTAGQVTVDKFGPVGNESGIQFSGAFANATPNSLVDYAIGYTVTAPKGFLITDAILVGNFVTTGSGGGSVAETLLFPNLTSKTLTLTSGGNSSPSVSFPGVSSITVTKDILLTVGASGGSAAITIIGQGFSSVPEPASMALLGIGMSGLFALRRFFRRPSVA